MGREGRHVWAEEEKPGKKLVATQDATPDGERKEQKIRIVKKEISAEVTTGRAPAGKMPTTGESRARVRKYDEFFRLYAEAIRKKELSCFWPGEYVPDWGIILRSRKDGKVQVVQATSDVVEKIGTIPTPWMAWEELPEWLREALEQYKRLVEGLGYEPSPFHLGLAKALLEKGQPPARYLAMGFTRFRYGNREEPFGTTLIPIREGRELTGFRVHLYNPNRLPDCPKDGDIITLAELKEKKGPVQKLVRTWALMEENYLSRYGRDGNPRQSNRSARQRPARSRQ